MSIVTCRCYTSDQTITYKILSSSRVTHVDQKGN